MTASAPVDAPLLSIRDLVVRFHTLRGVVHALEGVSLDVAARESVGLVGETGCGKSITARSVLRLVDPPGRIESGSIRFAGEELLAASDRRLREIRGERISMIMQEPRVSLNPVMRVGRQIAETLVTHDRSLSRRAAAERAQAMLAQVRIPDPRRMARRYPHELSGGMAQRVMIAMMLVTRPQLLIADEPTSALDVTIQAQILELMRNLIDDLHSSVLMITHDLAIVAETCERVVVMYAGQVVETGPVGNVLREPLHPYTRGLLATLPERARRGEALYSIDGNVPGLIDPPSGCRFAARCHAAMPRCSQLAPRLNATTDPGHEVACYLFDPDPAGA